MHSLPTDLEGEPWKAVRRESEALRSLSNRLEAGADPALRARVHRALEISECPRCSEVQADGVPCAGTGASCAECVRALDWIRNLRLELERALSGC
jgi:hypothetical protein